ncbi:Uncharacterised protein [uncultured archaeon]|nr:Uncharacterised protein [uncultured archaeon]
MKVSAFHVREPFLATRLRILSALAAEAYSVTADLPPESEESEVVRSSKSLSWLRNISQLGQVHEQFPQPWRYPVNPRIAGNGVKVPLLVGEDALRLPGELPLEQPPLLHSLSLEEPEPLSNPAFGRIQPSDLLRVLVAGEGHKSLRIGIGNLKLRPRPQVQAGLDGRLGADPIPELFIGRDEHEGMDCEQSKTPEVLCQFQTALDKSCIKITFGIRIIALQEIRKRRQHILSGHVWRIGKHAVVPAPHDVQQPHPFAGLAHEVALVLAR